MGVFAVLSLAIAATADRGFLLAATGAGILEGTDLAALLRVLCRSGFPTLLVIADSDDERRFENPCPDALRVRRLDDDWKRHVPRRKTRALRRFKLRAIASSCPFAETLYVDNDVLVTNDTRTVFEEGFRDARPVGVTVAARCVPNGHEISNVPADFCERQGGVLFLRCPAANPIMRSWLEIFEAHPSHDGHDQPALRRLAFTHPDVFHEIDKAVFNCRHPCSRRQRCLLYHAKTNRRTGARDEFDCFDRRIPPAR